jgi:hypothetical protein
MAEREEPRRRGPANQYPEQRDRPRDPDHPYDDRPHEWREVRDTEYAGVPGMAGWDLDRRRGDRPRADERRRSDEYRGGQDPRQRPEPEYGPGGEPSVREPVPEGWQDRGMRPGPQYGQPGGWNAPNPGQGYGGDVHAPGWSEREPFQRQANYAGRGPRGYVRSDERIADDLADRLTRDPRVDASEIEIEVKNCEVTLRGTVESRPMKHLAEDLADAIPGVRDVHNSLRVARVGSGQQERKTARPEVRVGEGGEPREGHIGPPPGQPAQSRNAADAGRPPA